MDLSNYATRVYLLLEEVLNNTISCFWMASFSPPPPSLLMFAGWVYVVMVSRDESCNSCCDALPVCLGPYIFIVFDDFKLPTTASVPKLSSWPFFSYMPLTKVSWELTTQDLWELYKYLSSLTVRWISSKVSILCFFSEFSLLLIVVAGLITQPSLTLVLLHCFTVPCLFFLCLLNKPPVLLPFY